MYESDFVPYVGINYRQRDAMHFLKLDARLLKACRKPVYREDAQGMRDCDWVNGFQEMGFEARHITAAGDPKHILFNEERQLVVKYLSICDRTPAPKKAIPTFFVMMLRNSKRYRIAIQPWVDTSEEARQRAHKIIFQEYASEYALEAACHEASNFEKLRRLRENYGDDTHSGNYGMWNDDAVVFDW